MERRFKVGDGLLTKEEMEMLRRDEFSMVGAFATAFEKMAKKVPGLAEEEQCATFLGHFKNWEASSLTKKAAPGKKLTWGAIKEGVLEGELDQVDIFQMKLARKKRKTLDTIASEGRNFKLMIEEAVAQHDAEKEARKKAMAVPQAQGKGKKVAVLEEEEEEEEEPEPQKLTKAQRKARNTTQGGQGSGKGQAPQAVAMPPPESSGQAAPAPYGLWPGCGPPSHWHGHCSYAPWPTGGPHGSCVRAPMSTASCGWPGPQSQQYIDPRIPGGIRDEALCRASAPAPPAPPTAFRIWQEVEDRQGVRIEEISENEEVEQGLRVDTIKKEPIVVESDDDEQDGGHGRARDTMERMEDLLTKIRRYQDKLTTLCEEVNRWKGELPLVYLIDSSLGAQGGSGNLPRVTVTAPTPRFGMTFRPPSRAGRAALAAHTRSKGAPDSSQPTQDNPGPSGEKETVEIPEDEEDEDERFRTEEDKKAEERAKKRDAKADASKEQEGKKRKYKVRMEKGFDVEGMVDRLLEGHNDLMNLKDILASAKKLRDELKARLSRRVLDLLKEHNLTARPTALGGVLIQQDLNGEEQPLRFESRTLNTTERNYSQFKRETLAVLHCLRIFRNYLFGSRFVLRVDLTALAGSLKNFAPSDPTIARWLTYIWMFDFELERIPGNKNRADGLSRVDWDKNNQGVIEDTSPVDGFLDSEVDVRLHINSWSMVVGNYVTPGQHVWLAPPGHVRRPDLVLKPCIEEDSWGVSNVQWMMNLALADKYQLHKDLLTMENGAQQVEGHETSIGGIYLLANALLQDEVARIRDQRQGKNENVVHEGEDDDFEEGEIKEAFCTEEYDGIYLELGMLLSCEMRERDACEKVLKMRPNFLVRDSHLFMRSKGKTPRRVVCGIARQIDVIAALYDGKAGGHRSKDTTFLKIHELYYWDDMGRMINDYCKSCVPCQQRSSIRPRELLHPRYICEVGAVVHLDLLAMPLGVGEYNFIFDARDNLSGFVDGRAIRTKTGETLARCIEEYYLRYPFVSKFVMDRGSEFTCAEVKELLRGYGVIAEYTTTAHPQANAPVERGHSTITNLLAKWTNGRPKQWPNFLRVAFFMDNITVRRSTNYAPTTLWYDRHATFPIESFLKTWRRQDLETNLSFEELLDLRACQINAIEDRIETAASKVADNRQRDKFRWDKMARVRKEPLKVGDVVLLYDSSLEKQWSRKLDKRWLGPYRVARSRERGAYQIEELNGTAWKDWVSGSRLKKFVARDELETSFWAAMLRGKGGAGPVETPLGVTRQGVQVRARREDRPPIYTGDNVELFMVGFMRHGHEFGWDSSRMLREVRGAGEWAQPLANFVRESLTWQDFEQKMESLHPSPLGRDERPIRFDATNLWEFLKGYDEFADSINEPPSQRVRGFILFVREHLRPFVRSIVEPAQNWGHCKKLLWNHYTPARQADERRSMGRKRKEPETAERRTSEQGMTSGAQRDGQRREHRSQRQERREDQHIGRTQQKEEQTVERTQRGGPSEGSDIPPQPAQIPEATPRPGMQPETSHRAQGQGQDEDQAAREKEQDKEERATIERKIRVQIRLKNMTELHEKVEQGEQSVILEDREGNGSPTQDDETPLFTEAWDNFDKLLEAAGRPKEQHQEMGVKLVSTDLINLKGLTKEGFATAKTSDEKMEKRLTRVARASHEQKMNWQKEIGDLKKEFERPDKKMEAMKTEVEKAWAGNEAIRQVNQTLNKVNDTLRTNLQVQHNIFQAKEAKWEKRIEDLEAKCVQQAPTTVVDWTEVKGFEIRKQPAEEAFKCQKVEERANEQKDEEIPLLDKEMLQPKEALARTGSETGGFEWRMPTALAHEVRSPAEDAMNEAALPMTQGETVGRQEVQESVGQAMAEAEEREEREVSQKTPPPQDMPLVAGLEDAQGSWATESGAEE
ncbi:hypothetical protein CBR_g40388 [Chara braunii]|uniref:Integrase catalytic domain-containing protein n=1 Tax=Chara braunii TaxID=69332 RepID=A0A388LTM1_CHABU|nr:hypothetical protein CBR_g40388 [Chara braunii]|eukprot:GBG85657.1 hypothetical protein CBR_g40388 [Chara braunii]